MHALLLVAALCACAAALPKHVSDQYLAGGMQTGGWGGQRLGGRLQVSRDDLEMLDTINQAYAPPGNGSATSMLLVDQLLALVQTAVDLEPPTLFETDDDGRPYQVYEEGDEPDDDPANVVGGDSAYAPFEAVLGRDVVYVRQPHGRYEGIAQVVDALIAEARQRVSERDPHITGVQLELTSMRKANLHVVRAVETQAVPHSGERRRILDTYFAHVRMQRSEYARADDIGGPWVIGLLERLPPVLNPVELRLTLN
jgi:hypothetical protein